MRVWALVCFAGYRINKDVPREALLACAAVLTVFRRAAEQHLQHRLELQINDTDSGWMVGDQVLSAAAGLGRG